MKKKQIHFTFSMRANLLAITCLAIPISTWARANHLKMLAGKHHFESLDHGYRATSIQIPREVRVKDRPPKLIKSDQETLAKVVENWRMCIHHANFRDAYFSAAKSPWFPVPDLPKMTHLQDPADLRYYWNNTVLPFLAENPSLLYSVTGSRRSDPKNAQFNAILLTSEQLSQLQTRIDSDPERDILQ